MRQIYTLRRRLLLDFLGAELGEWLAPIPSCCGMHVAAVSRTSVDLEYVTEALLRQNVKMHTLSRYFVGPQTRTGLIIGFGAADLSEMKQGLSALRKVLQRSALFPFADETPKRSR